MDAEKVKEVKGIFPAVKTSDGAGVKLKRALGTDRIEYIDPFLMFDEFSSDNPDDYILGFPPHPHRGFETVTYMIEGSMKHEDSTGKSGVLTGGSVQWMSAGRGVIHSEMPIQEKGMMRGFQLWVNLPRRLKMMEPQYRHIQAEDIPVIDLENDGFVKIIAGRVGDTEGPVRDVTVEPVYLDVRLGKNGTYMHQVDSKDSVFTYVFEGEIDFGNGPIAAGNLVTFGSGNTIYTKETGHGGRYLLLAALPLDEPVFRGGPFVMNTREEVMQAFSDYDSGKFA